MNSMRLIVLIIGLIVFVIGLGFIIPRETTPPSSTRVILEHNEKTYIAPSCFEQANASNFLEETTLEHAKEINYEAHSDCTKEALMSEKDSLIISLLKQFGLISTPWDSW